jgi:hypothetical protein
MFMPRANTSSTDREQIKELVGDLSLEDLLRVSSLMEIAKAKGWSKEETAQVLLYTVEQSFKE